MIDADRELEAELAPLRRMVWGLVGSAVVVLLGALGVIDFIVHFLGVR